MCCLNAFFILPCENRQKENIHMKFAESEKDPILFYSLPFDVSPVDFLLFTEK
jgi:hypothetical protein